MQAYDNAVKFAEEYEEHVREKPSYVLYNKAISEYVGDSSAINGLLLGYVKPYGDDDDMVIDIQNTIKNITSSMLDMEESISLYRGMKSVSDNSIFHNVKVGDVITNTAFLSTSRNPRIANHFAPRIYRDNYSNTIVEIRTGSTTQAITLDNDDTMEDEFETILGTNQRFKVVDILDDVNIGFNKISKYIVVDYVSELAEIKKSREGTDWTREHGLEFDEEKHRWVCPDGGCKVNTPHSHLTPHGYMGEESVEHPLITRFSERMNEENPTKAYVSIKNIARQEDMTTHPNYVNIQDWDALQNYVGLEDDDMHEAINSYVMWGFFRLCRRGVFGGSSR